VRKEGKQRFKSSSSEGTEPVYSGATCECCLLCSLSARTAQLCFMVLTPILLMRRHFNITRCNPDGTY